MFLFLSKKWSHGYHTETTNISWLNQICHTYKQVTSHNKQTHNNHMRGFEAYNKFKNDLKDSRQIYDITYHLYQTEKIRLDGELNNGSEVNPTLKTSIGSIEHSPTALNRRLQYLYPYKLRQLILISTITALEVYLTDVILEIFKRDIKPFKVNEPVTFQKNYLLSVASISKIQNDLIKKDFRSLTSGGMKEIEKYYKKMFEIDIKNLGINFQDIEEIHTRRHLFVHRNLTQVSINFMVDVSSFKNKKKAVPIGTALFIIFNT